MELYCTKQSISDDDTFQLLVTKEWDRVQHAEVRLNIKMSSY